MFIKQVLPLSERPYTDKMGQQKIFASRPLLLSDGIDTFCAELVGDSARRDDWKIGVWTGVRMSVSTREYNDKNGTKRYSNEIIITNIAQ